ncbi:Sulfotransferase domain protein [Actibacterium lipolyticum]|uniref:Sulfotransferase domain protein n=2 Tax=Actibacterium lipolyticum TaxID=1524263 RepID=A0A238JTU2_9RHOB|nr:Sulfotransferase domain protein [Actibacterium lipolyticum]
MFGIGATKAGTSWLHRYLAAHPDCHVRSIKELHFFDTIDKGRQNAQLSALQRNLQKLQRRQKNGDPANAITRAHRMADIEQYSRVLKKGDEAEYLAFLDEGRDGQRLIADITPSYALLSEGRMEKMANMAADVRFVYLLRDPVARLWSHVRMIAKRRTDAGNDIAERAREILERALGGFEVQITNRGDYRGTLERLNAAVDPSRLFLAFYEDLFSNTTIARLCAFLGIANKTADFGKRVHEGVPVELTMAQRGRAAAFLKPQYDYVEASLGQLPAAWEANRVGV